MKENKPYLYLGGLKKLAKKVKGTETIHMGIRPYGFHGGNVMALVVYPMLLCEFLEKNGKRARFRFIVSINDWEQDVLVGPDPRKYPFNVFPGRTILKHTPDEMRCCDSVVEHWEPIIKKYVGSIREKYPGVSMRFVRNSAIRKFKSSRDLLRKTLFDPHTQFEIFKKAGKDFLREPVIYAAPICPACKTAVRDYEAQGKEKIRFKCPECRKTMIRSLDRLDYWWYHKPLLLARMKAFKIDITISGGDHFSEGDFTIRRKLIREYFPRLKEPLMLFTPLVVLPDGEKMSKSRSNTFFIHPKVMLEMSRQNLNDTFIAMPALRQKRNEKIYHHFF